MPLLRICVAKPFLGPPGSPNKQFIFNLSRAEFWSGLSWSPVLSLLIWIRKSHSVTGLFKKWPKGSL